MASDRFMVLFKKGSVNPVELGKVLKRLGVGGWLVPVEELGCIEIVEIPNGYKNKKTALKMVRSPTGWAGAFTFLFITTARTAWTPR